MVNPYRVHVMGLNGYHHEVWEDVTIEELSQRDTASWSGVHGWVMTGYHAWDNAPAEIVELESDRCVFRFTQRAGWNDAGTEWSASRAQLRDGVLHLIVG